MSNLTNDEIYNITRDIQNIENSFQDFELDKIQFSLMSADDIKRVSVCHVTNINPTAANGINDPHMGPIEEKTPCQTCFNILARCPGHYGHIELAVGVINPEMKNCVLALLSCICNSCSSLLLPKTFITSNHALSSKKGLERLQLMKTYAEKHGRCTRVLEDGDTPCMKSPYYKTNENKDSHIVKYTCKYTKSKGGETSTNVRTVQDIYLILDNIKNEDLYYLGFDPKRSPHPRNFVFKNLAVIPPACRPHLYQDGVKKPDYTTTMYCHIITANNKLKNNTLTENERKDAEKKLNNHFSALISSTGDTSIIKSNGAKSLRKRLNGKEGLVRGKSMGKRVDHVARSVLGGGAQLPFSFIAVPEEFRSVLTTNDTVTKYNIQFIRKLYNEERILSNTPFSGQYEGVNMLVTPGNRKKLIPKCGDVVARNLINGDLVTFNRQPTLHQGGMMCFRLLFHKGKTLRILSHCTVATNADFDGDDANIYPHQSTEVKVENITVASIGANIANCQKSSIMVGLYYHAVIGAYVLSDPSVILDEEDWTTAMNLFRRSIYNGNKLDDIPIRLRDLDKRVKLSGIHPRSGRAIISALFPSNFNARIGKVIIKNGVLVQGQLTSSSLNGFGLVHHIMKNYGMMICQSFLSEAQWLFDWYLTIRPISIGLTHILPPDQEELTEFVYDSLGKTQKMVDTFYKEPIDEIERESKILNALHRTEDKGKKLARKFLTSDNPFVKVYESGAKGSVNNLSCMGYMFGQELNGGKRPRRKYSNGTRFCALNDFESNDVISRGFIIDSFVQGLAPVSFLMHMDAARDGINTSNLSTPSAGFFSRQSNMLLNSVRLGSEGQVELVNGSIVQFCYGDGFDVSKYTLNNSNVRGVEKYFINLQDTIDTLIYEEITKNKK